MNHSAIIELLTVCIVILLGVLASTIAVWLAGPEETRFYRAKAAGVTFATGTGTMVVILNAIGLL